MAKEQDSKQERRPLFAADELAVARFFTLFTFDDSFKVGPGQFVSSFVVVDRF
jgi:hypothetical protein